MRFNKLTLLPASMALIASASLLSACSMSTDGDYHTETVDSETAEINNGTPGHRRELVTVNSGCTGTLIGTRWVLTAAHCLNYIDALDADPIQPSSIQTSTDGVNWGTGTTNCASNGCRFPVDRTFNLGDESRLGDPDVMLMRLRTPVPSSFFVPASLASTLPAPHNPPSLGSVFQIWGRGLTDAPGGGMCDGPAGAMSYITTFLAPSYGLCQGDSGGPWMYSKGGVFGVSSTASSYGNVVDYRSEIQTIMSTWDAYAANEIRNTNWCTHATGTIHWGDVDNDGDPDAICHSYDSGWRHTARTTGRLTRHTSQLANAFCNGADDRLLTADVSGDGRTDLVCHHRSGTEGITIDFADASGNYNNGTFGDRFYPSGFCTHSGAKIHLGDFNGDGKADLMCRDQTGARSIDFSIGGTNPFAGNPTVDHQRFDGWCSHATATVHIGDFNGDGASDMLCHTASTGSLDVELSSGTNVPFQGVNDHWLHTARATSTTCSSSSACGSHETCISGTCQERFCNKSTSELSIADYTGDGRSDLLCTASDGTTSLLRAFGGEASNPGHTAAFSWLTSYVAKWGAGLMPRTADAAARPMSL